MKPGNGGEGTRCWEIENHDSGAQQQVQFALAMVVLASSNVDWSCSVHSFFDL
jgi:hypothetical protein